MAYLYDMEKKDKAEPKPGAPEAVEAEEVEVEVEKEVVKVEKKAIKSAPQNKAIFMEEKPGAKQADKVVTLALGEYLK